MARFQERAGTAGALASPVVGLVLNLTGVLSLGWSAAAGLGGVVPTMWVAFRGIKNMSEAPEEARQLSSIVRKWLSIQTNVEIRENTANYLYLMIDNQNRLIFTDFPNPRKLHSLVY